MAETKSAGKRLNFTWLVEGKVAGHARLLSKSDLAFLMHGLKTTISID